MYHSTRGIFLKQFKYSETSSIVRIYTEEFGLQVYIIKGLRSKKSKIRPGLLQPLSLLDMVVTHRDKSDLQYIKELKSAYLFKTLYYDISKSSIVLFLDELLVKSIQEENRNDELFGFLYESIKLLDILEEAINNFHLVFALHLTGYLGFYPGGSFSKDQQVFDMEEGSFVKDPGVVSATLITGDTCRNFAMILNASYQDLKDLNITLSARETLLEKILQYYSLHLPSVTGLKSHLILKEVLK